MRADVTRAAVLCALLVAPRAAGGSPVTRLEIVPGPDGTIGAWMLLGPFPARAARATSEAALDSRPLPLEAAQVEEASLTPAAASVAGKAWALATSGDGVIDVRGALRAKGSDLVAYAEATLHIDRSGRFLLLVGADDGVKVFLDGNPLLTRDESRPQRDDDDIVPFEANAGDHQLLLKFHQRDGGWAFKVRLLDAQLAPPEGSFVALDGTTEVDARRSVERLSWVSIDRGVSLTGGAYRPKVTVRFPAGAPRGVDLRTRVKLTALKDGAVKIDVDAGTVGLGPRGADEMTVSLPWLDDGDIPGTVARYEYEVTVGDRRVKSAFAPRRSVLTAIARSTRALAATEGEAEWLRAGSRESVTYARDRLAALVARGDTDGEALDADAGELSSLAASMEAHRDPYETRTGAMRRALTSSADGKPAPFGLYVPRLYRPGSARRYPLVVGLHGLNGRPMAMIRYLFGHDDPQKDNDWEDRHVGDLEPLDAFVVTPNGHGNTMYRDLGEDEVLRVVAWALGRYPIDPDRVTITGMSMGGIGAASIPLHHPGIFAAAEPLCGYHSYFVRRDIAGHPLRPWERALAEERSNVFWAENGEHLPLSIVHGTLDLPEANSGVLIAKYEDLHYDVVHEHPHLGHNVWQTTYEGLKGIKWLLGQRREAHPRDVVFTTMRLRAADDAWLHVDSLARPDAWGHVHARVVRNGAVRVTTDGVLGLHLDRDPVAGITTGPLAVALDGTNMAFGEGEDVYAHRSSLAGPWTKGASSDPALSKHGTVTGPIREIFHEPILFVYGASDPEQARANEEVARRWAAIRYGVSVDYPVMSDLEFERQHEPLANDRALFLVGNAKGNAVVRELESELPARIADGAVVLGGERFTGREVGAAFIRPNPRRLDRYVVVVEGVDAPGTWRSLSLPDLLPDFVVYDADVASARGQMILGAATVRAAGFFGNDWSLPASLHDPLLHADRARARNENEATPYLP